MIKVDKVFLAYVKTAKACGLSMSEVRREWCRVYLVICFDILTQETNNVR